MTGAQPSATLGDRKKSEAKMGVYKRPWTDAENERLRTFVAQSSAPPLH
jgi:hypothetical protein